MKKKRGLLSLIAFVVILLVVGFFVFWHFNKEIIMADNEDKTKEENDVGLANPASVYCLEQDGTLEVREDEAGNQYGVCIFSDGSECEEWTYYNGECKPGEEFNITR